MWTTLTLVMLLAPSPAGPVTEAPATDARRTTAQGASSDRALSPETRPIQDNSFLIEEAYNQEQGVIQHINTFQRFGNSRDWTYTFTEEWPVRSQAHQLSVTVPLQHLTASPDGRTAAGDVALNYRYQLAGSGDTRLAIAPRMTLMLPVGDASQLRGTGAVGYQINLPVSVALSRSFVTHGNVGATFTPRSLGADGARAATTAFNAGQSLVWLASDRVNALVELAFNRGQAVIGPGHTQQIDSLFLNPGLRWAIDLPSGLQVVPGVAVPIGLGPSRGERALFLYLSFEHPLSKAR